MTEGTDGRTGVPGPTSATLVLEPVPHPSGPVLLRATGEIDDVTAADLAEHLVAWFGAAPRVVLDLSGVSFLGSPGLSVLLAAHRDAAAGGVTFQLRCGDARQVRRVLQTTGTLEYLDVLDRIPAGGAGRAPHAALFAVPPGDDGQDPTGPDSDTTEDGRGVTLL
ncbi:MULTISPECIES: STAS domain-containing protein [unclassified Pseudonocardia]|uniref:STAS domain-containing protein n=1 Tax=unclassified Pseudonocardia TaxID=2619320 RepID=UPI0001FFED4A|nr:MULTISPECIES: STAS domain-containing protein [unclassified Pseudonocardia]OLM19854.1 hypothetical protein Ae707Ps1_4113c [Pseudonocardia sp. Ae707_Ps1]